MKVENKSKRLELKSIFEKLFSSKGYRLFDNFGDNIWFLNNNWNQNNKRKQVSLQKINSIISSISLNNNDNKGRFKINVETFIEKVLDYIFSLQKQVEEANANIREYNINRNVQIIPNVINELNLQKEKKDKKNSELKFSLARMDNFPEGSYEFHLYINYTSGEPKKLTLGNRNDIIFIDKKNEMVMMSGDNSSTFEKCEFWIDDTKEVSDFQDVTNNEDNDNESGTNLVSYYIDISKDGNFYFHSHPNYFFHNFLNVTEDLKNLTSKICMTTLKYKIQNQNFEHDKEKYDTNLYMTLMIDFDHHTRISVLKRILKLFNNVLRTKKEKTELLYDFLTDNFGEIAIQVKDCLNQKKYEERDNCCNECMAF